MSAVAAIDLRSHDPGWADRFEQLRGRLEEALPAAIVSIEHVGGTAVAGLIAQPVIDIDVAVADYSRAYQLRPVIEALGFERSLAGDGSDRQEYLLREGGAVVARVALTYPGSAHLRRDLALRERLRSDAEARRGYAELKARLAREGVVGAAYEAGKAGFVAELVGAGWKEESGTRGFLTPRRVAIGAALLVLLATLVGGYLFLGYTAENSRDSDGLPDHRQVRAADLWSRAPARLYYPGSTIISTRGRDATGDLGGAPAQVETTLRTDVAPEVLGTWYSERLASLGWLALPADPATSAGRLDLNWRKGRREYVEVQVLADPIGTALAYSVRYEIGTGR